MQSYPEDDLWAEPPAPLDWAEIERQTEAIRLQQAADAPIAAGLGQGGLAPDFARLLPNDAIAADERQTAADDFQTRARAELADRWRQVSQRSLKDTLLGGLPEPLQAAGEAIGSILPGPNYEELTATPPVRPEPIEGPTIGPSYAGKVTDPLTYLRNFIANLPEEGGPARLNALFGEAIASSSRLAAAYRQTTRPETEPGTLENIAQNIEEFAVGAIADPTNIPFFFGRQALKAIPKAANAADDLLLAKLGGGADPPDPNKVLDFITDLPRNLRKGILSADARLSDAQEAVTKVYGRELPPELRARDLFHIEGGAFQRGLLTVRNELRDAYALAHGDVPALEKYLEAYDNIDKAASIGRRVDREVLDRLTTAAEGELGRAPGRQAGRVAAASQLEIAADRALDRAAAATDDTVKATEEALARRLMRQAAAQERQAARALEGAAVRYGTKTMEAPLLSARAGREAATARMFPGELNVEQSADALRILRSELGTTRFGDVERAAEGVYRVVDATRARLVQAGVWSEDLAGQLARDFPHYIPTNILDYTADPSVVAAGKKITMGDAGPWRLTEEGTTKAREKVTDSLVRMVFESERRAAKNETAWAVYNWRNISDDLADVMRDVPDTYRATKDEVIAHFFDRGVKHRVAVDKPFAEAIEIEPSARLPSAIEAIFGKPAAVVRATAVTHNPTFAITGNPVFDVPSFLFHSSTFYGPQRLPVFVAELIRSVPDVFSGFTKGQYTGEGLRKFWTQGGGQLGYFGGAKEELGRYATEVRKGGGEVVENPGQLIKGLLWDLTPAVGQRIENAPRVAGMRLAERYGADQLTATMRGRGATMDFTEGGEWTKTLNSIIPFFNISTRPVPWLINLAKKNPKGFAATTGVVAGAVVVAEAWNRSDQERAEAYDDVPGYIKRQGLVVMAPHPRVGTDQYGRDRLNYVLGPARNFTGLVGLAREAIMTAMGASSPQDWANTLMGVIGTSSPVQTDSATTAIGAFVPGFLGTAAQLVTNQDFFRDRAIASEFADEQATAPAKMIGGATGIRPSQVEFAVRDTLTGVGGIVLAAGDLAAKIKDGQPVTEPNSTISQMPVVGGMLKRFLPTLGGGHDQDLRNLREEVRSALIEERKRLIGTAKWDTLPDASRSQIEAQAGQAATGLVYGTETQPFAIMKRLRDSLQAAGHSPEQISSEMADLRGRLKALEKRVEPVRGRELGKRGITVREPRSASVQKALVELGVGR